MGLLSPVSYQEAFLKFLRIEALRPLAICEHPKLLLLSVSSPRLPLFTVAISGVCKDPRTPSVVIPGCGNTSVEEGLSPS